ncbi:Gfo/Idh/MocA family protein [Solibacillus sp. NPDC093137]|uniref:Gfo/Idh/MocA family protein n=1 Tax=Solibacillus sp. NPDC093137 TaxID=3390678 RepID=UPI003D094D75
MLKIGVIGLGDISKIHIPAIQSNPYVELAAVCDIDPEMEGTVEGPVFYTDYHKMLEKETLDCVHICLPHHLHYTATKACVEKGIHVFQEKPLALDANEGKSLVELEALNPNIKIGISLQNRRNETVIKLLEISASGEYGKILGIKGLVAWFRPKEYYDIKPWRGQMKYAGGGVMINQALHTIDLMQLFGGEIKTIKGSIDELLDYGLDVEDTATARIEFINGAKGLLFATNANAENSSVELELLFEKGKFTIKDSILTETLVDGTKLKLEEDRKLPGMKFYYGASHVKLINEFYECIRHNTDGYIKAKDAQVSMEMINAIRQSSISGKQIAMGVYQ